ncbi:MAG: SHD1 domain-containing protein [Planctomycetota bacterium]
MNFNFSSCAIRPFKWLLLAASIAFLFTNVASAQLKLEEGEDIKVNTFWGWKDGVIVEVGKSKQYLVEYYFGSSPKQEAFHRNQLRKLYEFQAMDFARIWKSSAGTFEIEAALKLVKTTDDVVLLKPDLSEITVALDKLSKRDQQYVKKFKRNFDRAVAAGQIPAPWPKLPEIESFADTSFSSSKAFDTSKLELQPFGKLPSYLREFKHQGVGFRMTRPRQELVSAIAVGGPEQLVLVNGREGNFFNKGVMFQSQLYWLSMKQKKVTASVAVANEDYALDYDPRTKYLLTFNEEEFARDNEEPHHLTIWKLGFGETDIEPVIRWNISSRFPRFGDLKFGKIINENIVLTKGERHEYIGWDISKKEIAYTIRTESFFDAPVRLTGDRRYLIVPEDGRLSIFDATNGDFVMGTQVDARHVSGANVNADGTKLAAVTEKDIFVWDLESRRPEPDRYSAPLIGSPFESTIDFIDDDKVLVDGFSNRVLFSLRLGVPLWTYKTENPFFDDDPLVNYVSNGIVFYTDQDFFRSQNVAVGAVELPGPQVEELTANIQPEDLMIMKPGVAVSIELNNVDSAATVEGWLKEEIAENGWVYDPNAEIVLKGEMGIGPSQSVQYSSSGAFGRDKDVTTVNFRPHYSSLKLMRGKQIIWQSGTQSGAPPVITGNDNQIQSRINSFQKPNVQFFKRVEIEAELIDPKYSRGFGVSKLGKRGIEVVSATPPGREDDPLAAQKEFEKEREKAIEDRKKIGGDETEGSGSNDPNSNVEGGNNAGGR